MKIYRIYKWIQGFEWSPYSDDYIQIDEQKTIKYVDSKEKVNAFFYEIEEQNKPGKKCLHCPLINLTKRQYKNGKHDVVINSFDCYSKDIYFQGNKVFCRNAAEVDFTEYDYEEIEVK